MQGSHFEAMWVRCTRSGGNGGFPNVKLDKNNVKKWLDITSCPGPVWHITILSVLYGLYVGVGHM